MRRAGKAALEYIKKADMFLLILSILCAVFGIVLIWSATRSFSGGAGSFLTVQIMALVLGLFGFVLSSVIDVEVMAQRWKALLIFNVLILLSLFVFGVGIAGGDRIWLRFFGIGIQPSEIVKITFIIMLAYQIHYLKEYKNLNSFFSLMQLAAHFVLIFVLLPDMGNSLIFLFIFVVMLFMGGVKLRWFVLGGTLLVALFVLAWENNFFAPYQMNRIMAPFDSSIDPLNQGVNFQVHRSRIAIASGQIFGQGLGQGTQTQAGSVPEQQTDILFSAAAEEFGFIGALAVIALIVLVIIRCFYVGAKARNTLSALTCVGVGSFIMFQSLVNIGMTMGVAPVIGIAPPFFAYGGSSLVTTFIALGLVSGVKMRTVSPWKRSLY